MAISSQLFSTLATTTRAASTYNTIVSRARVLPHEVKCSLFYKKNVLFLIEVHQFQKKVHAFQEMYVPCKLYMCIDK
jgi:hypothetical protein